MNKLSKPKKIIEICEQCKFYCRMFDKENEKNGYVSCNHSSHKYYTFLYRKVDDDCPYKMEHLILLGEK